MQTTQGSSSSSSSSGSEGEHEAVIRDLTRGHELTAQLREEALRVLRGHGQAEATAALILQEVSRAFTVCLSIMSSPARAPPPAPTVEMPALQAPARRSRDDSIPREQRRTSSPHHDGYQWRKYGQKRISKTPQFPRCYFKCSLHRERNCRATKQVQQCSNGDPPQYVVMYFNEHTCDTTPASSWEPSSSGVLPSVSGLPLPVARARSRHALLMLDERRGVQEEHERQLLVSSLTCVLGGQQHQFQQSPAAGISSSAADDAGHHGEQEQEPGPPRAGVDAPGDTSITGVDDVAAGLDVMDYYDVTDALCFDDDSYNVDLPLPDDGFQF